MKITMKWQAAAAAAIILLAGGCKDNNNRNVPSFNLDEINQKAELKLSDLVEDIKIIPLETNDSIRVKENYGGGYRAVVTKEFIFMLGDNGILVFDAKNGKYIRQITTEGRGPKEHGTIYSVAADYKKEIFYISHMNANSKLAVNYKTGEYCGSIPDTTRYGVQNLWCVLPDGTICGDYLYGMFCRIDPATGGILPMVDPQKQLQLQKMQEGKKMHTGVSVRLQEDKIYIFNQRYSDTLYLYHGPDHLSGVLALRTDDSQNENNNSKIHFPYIDSENILCIKYEILINKSIKDGIITNIFVLNQPDNLFSFSTADGTLKKISKFIFDPLFVMEYKDKRAAGFFVSSVFGNPYYFAKILDAYEVKDAIHNTLEDKSLSKSKANKLRELDARLHEDDNPVVIIGKKK